MGTNGLLRWSSKYIWTKFLNFSIEMKKIELLLGGKQNKGELLHDVNFQASGIARTSRISFSSLERISKTISFIKRNTVENNAA